LLLLILVWLAPVLPADTYLRQPAVDALHYVFRLTLAEETDQIAGAATVDLRFHHDGATEFALDLVSAAEGKGMTVTEVASGGSAVRYRHHSDRLTVTLAPPSKAGEHRQFTVRYRGIPARGLRIGTNRHKERTYFSVNWPNLARGWLPMIDHPYDKATSEFLITAPVKYQVVANGLLQEAIDLGDGRRLTHWKQSVPIASWLNAVGVARFAARHFGTARGIPLQTWVFPQDREKGMATLEAPTLQAIEFFSERIGPYPYEKLANVQAAGLRGGTEHASAIFYGEDAVTGRPATTLVAHEIAHQWWGNSVTEKDWDDVWLSEGFATYFALLFTEYYLGRDAFVAGLKRSRAAVLGVETKSPGLAVIHNNLADMRRVLNQLVYQKGGWVLHMLRGRIGTEAFWAGIRDYYRRYRDANASTDDFRRVIEETSGQELGWFFRQWLNRAGSPSVEGWWSYNAAARKIEIELVQTQPGDAYRLPLEIGVSASDDAPLLIERIEMTAKRQRFELAAGAEPAAVAFDPNTWALMETRFHRR